MKTLSLPSKIVAIVVATLLALMGILPFLSSSKAFAEEDATLEASWKIDVKYTKELTFTGAEQNFALQSVTYDDEPAALMGSVMAEEGEYYYKVEGDVTATNYKKSGYEATVTVYEYVKDHWSSKERKWVYEYEKKGSKDCDWSIAKKVIEVPAGLTYTFDGTEKDAVEASEWYAYSEHEGYGEITNTATDAGEYKALLVLTDTNNTKWEKNELVELEAFKDYREVYWTIEQNTELAVTQGDVKWIKGSKDAAVLTTNGVKDQCETIVVSNEKGWSKEIYNAEGGAVEGIEITSGSTILTASAAALETLDAGKYTVNFTYNDENYDPAVVETTLTVVEPTVAKTGDNAALIAMAGLALVAAAGACIALSMKRREN